MIKKDAINEEEEFKMRQKLAKGRIMGIAYAKNKVQTIKIRA